MIRFPNPFPSRGWKAPRLYLKAVRRADRTRRRPNVESLEARQLLAAIHEYPISHIGVMNPSPAGITSGADGNLWFTDLYGGFAGTAGSVGRIAPADQTIPPQGLILADNAFVLPPGGNRYVPGQTIPGGTLLPKGTVTVFADPDSIGDFPVPAGIVAHPDGSVWFTSVGGGFIGTYTPDGVVAVPDTSGILVAAQPQGITVDASKNLWFTEPRANTIGRYIRYPLMGDNPILHFVIPSTDAIPLFPTGQPSGTQSMTTGPDGNVRPPDLGGL